MAVRRCSLARRFVAETTTASLPACDEIDPANCHDTTTGTPATPRQPFRATRRRDRTFDLENDKPAEPATYKIGAVHVAILRRTVMKRSRSARRCRCR
jgi:hypothetical protein